MSLAESPLHSSSSDAFAGLLERELESGSSEPSPEEEDEEDKEADDVESESRIKRRKGDNLESVEETNGSTSQGLSEQNSEASATEDMCAHPGSFGDMCFLCGQRLIEQSGVTFGYIHKGLRLNNDEIDRLRNTDIKKSLNNKKLYLVLDLDHTLLNSTQLNHMTAEEKNLMSPPDSLPVWYFHMC
ncbi:RNA polymerase II C-terminal domain phosphatase-like 4 [Rosa rugosa]|uniref:RNA polymerase II C-terminal domain phosphatase-like 4 n=1 Tax=Rosa rugosa TaxID=74645 RepID=UPI002B415F33|nr:RNA polymerase II C-terminal domain phosphatase-like 4 [Rosa rugosa]